MSDTLTMGKFSVTVEEQGLNDLLVGPEDFELYPPLGFDAGDGNLYRYVGNDPTNETDPSGLDAVGVQGDNVVWRVPANDNRSGLRKFWDGLTGQNQNPERSYVIGRVSGQDGYLNSVILSDELGGRRVSLADLQQAARVVSLGGVAPEQQAGAVAYQIQKTIFGLYGSETPTQDRIVGALSSGMQFAVDNAKMVASVAPGVSVDSIERTAGITPGAESDAMLGGFVGNPNGSAYHQGKVEGDGLIMMGMAVDLAFPGGILALRGGGATSNSTVLRSSGRLDPYIPRSATLGERVSLAELTEGALIPGREGVTLTDKTLRFGDIYSLTERTGIEYALTRETVGGDRIFRLYSGGRNAVTTPSGLNTRLIGHTHPSGIGIPSGADIRAINTRFLDLIDSNPYAHVPNARVIFGPGNVDSTIYYPTLLR